MYSFVGMAIAVPLLTSSSLTATSQNKEAAGAVAAVQQLHMELFNSFQGKFKFNPVKLAMLKEIIVSTLRELGHMLSLS